MYFRTLARYLGDNQPFYGLQAKGLDGRSEPHEHVEEIATDYIKAIKIIQSKGPYFIGGHSFGGSVAFEIAQQLHKEGETVALLAILDIPAFTFSRSNLAILDWDTTKWLTMVVQVIEILSGKQLEVSPDILYSMSSFDQQLEHLREKMESVDLLPPKAGIDYVKGIVQVIKANELALIQYKPQGGYPHPITLFRTSEVYHDELGFLNDIPQDPTWGWSRLSTQPVEIQVVPGNHTTMLVEPHVKVLAEHLNRYIQRARNNLKKKSYEESL